MDLTPEYIEEVKKKMRVNYEKNEIVRLDGLPLIYRKMAEIITAVGSVSKDRTSVGKFSFKYRGIDDVMNALHQAFAESGVFVQQEVLDHTMSQIEGRGIHHIARVRFSFTTTDGSSVQSIIYGECIENGDKGIGKCMSYALKTCLLQTFLIPTEDESKDPDSTNQPILKSASKAPKNAPQETAGPTLSELKADAIEYFGSFGPLWLEKTQKPVEYYVKLIRDVEDMPKFKQYANKMQNIVDSWSSAG